MEINPIAGIRGVLAVNQPKDDPQHFAVFEIENAFGQQQDTFAHNEGKMTGGQDDETAEQEEASAESSADAPNGESKSTVNFIA